MAKYKDEISRETFEQIERYLLGSMDAGTRLEFGNRMKDDPELAAEISLQRKLLAAIEADGFAAGNPQLRAIGPRRTYVRWYVAAAAILVFGATGFWFFWQLTTGAANLYARYYQPDPGLPVEMGDADSTSYVFYDGMISYKEGNYSHALTKWEKLVHSAVNQDTLQYYIGMAYLNAGNSDKSISILQHLAAKPGAAYYQQANWYTALAYLKKGDREKARAVLMKIRAYPEALTLLNDL